MQFHHQGLVVKNETNDLPPYHSDLHWLRQDNALAGMVLGTMIGKLKNLGKRSQEMLAAAGIKTEDQLRAKGAAVALVAVKRAGCEPSLNLLWAIKGALTQRDWKEVARGDRLSLLTQVEILEKGQP